MRSVGIKLLKKGLSEYVRLAAGGETVLVTDRDHVVAELGPPAADRSPVVSDALLLDAVRQGWIRPPLSVTKQMPARKPVMRLSEVLRHLQDDRADRRFISPWRLRLFSPKIAFRRPHCGTSRWSQVGCLSGDE